MPDDRYPNYPPNCPPETQDDCQGTYFRAVKFKDRIRDRDFFSPARLQEGIEMDPCEREAVSVFASLEDAKSALKLMWGHPRRFIAELCLNGNHGVLRSTPGELQSHYDWWIPVNTDPRQFLVETHGPF